MDEKETSLAKKCLEMIKRLDDWEDKHPEANLTQMEDALDAELMPIRALMLERLSLKRVAEEKQDEQRPRCKKCAKPMQRRGKQKRKLITLGNSGIDIEREYYYCEQCKVGFFPPR